MKRNIALLLFCFVPYSVWSVDNLRQMDIRSLAIGGGGATESSLFNPSLVTLSTKKSIHISYVNQYALKELSTIRASFIYPNEQLPMAVDICSFGYDAYRESMIRWSVGKQLNDRWRIGVSIQYSFLQTELVENIPKVLSTDIGALYSPVDKLLIGMLIMNFPSVKLSSYTSEINNFISYSVLLSFQWRVINSLLIVGTTESNREDVLSGSIGIEYAPFNHFHIRVGIKANPVLPTFGIGYRFSRFTLDLTAIYHPMLGLSTGLGFCYSF